MKRIIKGELILTLFYLVIALVNGGLTYFMFLTIPLAYIILAIYLPNKKDLH